MQCSLYLLISSSLSFKNWILKKKKKAVISTGNLFFLVDCLRIKYMLTYQVKYRVGQFFFRFNILCVSSMKLDSLVDLCAGEDS